LSSPAEGTVWICWYFILYYIILYYIMLREGAVLIEPGRGNGLDLLIYDLKSHHITLAVFVAPDQ
jgi:hypothetical protein